MAFVVCHVHVTIRYSSNYNLQINDDAVGRSVDETIRLLKGFQWADSHVGEACPAGWTPGAKTVSLCCTVPSLE